MHVSHDSPSGLRVLSTTTFLRRTRAYMYARSQCRFTWPSRRLCNSPKPKASTGHSWPSALRHSSATVQPSILRSSHRYARYSERLASIIVFQHVRTATAPPQRRIGMWYMRGGNLIKSSSNLSRTYRMTLFCCATMSVIGPQV
jgi:hypothetical protein